MSWFVALLLPGIVLSKNIFVSSPFDNFRIECPKKSGAVELSVRMVESVGAKRQDIVFDMSCENIEELYPWVNIPVGISDMEREDCYYSSMFDPILDEDTEFTCKNREYFAGITRLTDTRIQVLCCRLRSRTEFNCHEIQFNKPIGLSRSTIVEGDNQVINAIRVNDRGYIVRFCDLAPRNIPEIYDDVKTTTERPSTTLKENPKIKVSKTAAPVNPYSTRAPVVSDVARIPVQLPGMDVFGQKVPEYTPTKSPMMVRINTPPTTLETTPRPTTEAPTTQKTTTPATTQKTTPSTVAPTTPKPTTTTRATTTTKATTTTRPPTTRTTTTTQAPTTTPRRTTTTTPAPEEPIRNSVEDSMEQIEADAPQTPLEEDTTTPPVKSMEDITMVENLSRVTFNNDDFPKANEKKLAVPGKMKFTKNQLPRRPGTSAENEFVFLPSINHEGVRRAPVRTYRPHINLWDDEEDEMEEMYGRMGFTSSERKIRRKVTRAHRLPPPSKEETSISDVSKEALDQNMMKIPDRETLYLKEDARKLPPGARDDLPATRRNPGATVLVEKVDNARFVDEETVSSPFEDGLQAQETRVTSVYDRVDLEQAEDIEDVINRLSLHPESIRRAPVRNSEPAETQSEKTDRAHSKDGLRTHVPKEHEEPIPINDLVIFDSKYKERKAKGEALVPMMSPTFFGDVTTPTTTISSSTITETTEENITPPATTKPATTTEYDPANFYHTPRPKPPKKEKVLTFCTKDIAIRDERNMVIACGGEQDVWIPNRCPQGTDCFVSSDSTYRICCPISKG